MLHTIFYCFSQFYGFFSIVIHQVVIAHTVGLSWKELKLGSSKEKVNIVVALKRLMNDVDPDTQDAFEKDIQFMSHLDHKNVLHLLVHVVHVRHSFVRFSSCS